MANSKQNEKINKAKAGLGNFQAARSSRRTALSMWTPGKPWFNVGPHRPVVNNKIENEAAGKRAIEELRQQDKRFFSCPLRPARSSGPQVRGPPGILQRIKEDDLWTGKIIAALKDLKLYEKTLVYVVVDHGFNVGEFGHRYAPYVFLATNDKKVNRNGTREDIAPTVLKRFGVDLAKIEPKLDGIPLDEPAPERKAPARASQAGRGAEFVPALSQERVRLPNRKRHPVCSSRAGCLSALTANPLCASVRATVSLASRHRREHSRRSR